MRNGFDPKVFRSDQPPKQPVFMKVTTGIDIDISCLFVPTLQRITLKYVSCHALQKCIHFLRYQSTYH